MTSTLIGRDTTTNKDIEIEQGHRTRGLYIIGATGSGKSVLTEQLAVQDAKNGLGFCVIDPHGQREDSLINNILVRIPPSRANDVILLDPLDTDWPFGLNLFSCDDIHDPIAVSRTLNQISHVFAKIFGMSLETPRLRYFVRNLSLALMGTEYTMCEVPHMLLNKPFRDRVIQRPEMSDNLFWKSFQSLSASIQEANAESTLDRADGLTTDPIIRYIVGQSTSKLDFRKIMDTSKIVLVPLAAELEDMTKLIGAILVGQILQAALGRKNVKKHFNLYLDEFHQYATADMPTLLVQARGFGIGTAICHQSRFQEGITDSIRSTTLQASSLVVFRVTSEDADELASNFNTAPPQAVKPPGTVPADILNHLTDHPHEDVKFFWTIYVKKLLEAKTMQPQYRLADYFNLQEEKPYPYFFIDEQRVYFDPEFGRQLLEYLQLLFYNSSTHKGGNEALFKEANILFVQSLNQGPPINRSKYLSLFTDSLKYALFEVWQTPIETTTTEWHENPTTQQSHADRKAQIANELTHLPIGTAKVRIPKWDKDAREVVMVEHTIRSILPYTPKADLARAPKLRQMYLEQTRKQYCRPRAEVEEEIRKRTLPPPSTTRRDSI